MAHSGSISTYIARTTKHDSLDSLDSFTWLYTSGGFYCRDVMEGDFRNREMAPSDRLVEIRSSDSDRCWRGPLQV